MPKLNSEFSFLRPELKDGMILHSRSRTLFGRAIRWCIPQTWGNHDALLIYRKGTWWVGESVAPFARLIPLEHYELGVRAGEYEVKVYDVVGASYEHRQKAVDYWLTHVLNTFYDFLALPRLALKALVKDVWPKAAGWEWAHWCTEGVAFAWNIGAGLIVWDKSNPTPYTTEKRVGSTLVDVTRFVTRR